MTLIRSIFLTLLLAASGSSLSFLPQIWETPRDYELVPKANELDDVATLDAIQKLTPEEIQSLRQREVDYLADNPLDARSLQNFAILNSLASTNNNSSELNLLLARYSLRNIGVQLIAVNTLSEQGQFAEALFRLDAVLRSTPTIQAQLFPVIMKLTENKAALAEIAKTLSREPPWRKKFMTYVAKAEPTGQLTYSLLKQMREAGSSTQQEELRNILSVWVQSGQIEKAYFVWLDLLPPDELKSLKLIYDGEFNREARSQFFDWTIKPKANALIKIVRKPGSAVDRSLFLDLVGHTGRFTNVSQLLRLVPGKYDVRFDVMAQNFKSEGGLIWRAYCMNLTSGNTITLGTSSAITETIPWTSLVFSLDVPAENCDTQILRLESKAQSGLDTAINGQVYFDDFKIERVERSTAQ